MPRLPTTDLEKFHRKMMADLFRKIRRDNPAMARLLFHRAKSAETEIQRQYA